MCKLLSTLFLLGFLIITVKTEFCLWFMKQILSWKPRALYFPNFATPEQCQNVVKLAKSRLRPSTLALRAGETEEGTKGIRTR